MRNSKTFIFFYFLLVFFYQFISISSYFFSLPIGVINEKKNDSLSFAENLFFNQLYVNLSLGTTPQMSPVRLYEDNTDFYLTDKYFDMNKSSTFENRGIALYYGEIINGWHGIDILNINPINNINNNLYTNKKIKFVVGENNKKLGNIGLRLPNQNDPGSITFLNSLKTANLTDSYTWTLKFNKNLNLFDTLATNYNYYSNLNKDNNLYVSNSFGEFLFGGEPHEYEKNTKLYNEKNYYKTSIEIKPNIMFWDIFFNSVYLNISDSTNNNKIKLINGIIKVEFTISASYIVGSNEYYNIIKQEFFDKYEYLSSGICEEKKIYDKNYAYFICDSDEKKFNIKEFPSLYFEQKELETVFELNYKDLFSLDKKNNKYVFLIYFSSYKRVSWLIGLPFLKKYQFTFNEINKNIGYYKENFDNDENENNKNKIMKFVVIIGLGIILCVVMIFVGMIIQKYYCGGNRKVRANELDDNYLYESADNKDEDKGINNN